MVDDESGRLRKADWLIADAAIDRARALIVQHHYAKGAANTATFLHGLYRRSDYLLCGVAWWMPPTRQCAAAAYTDPCGVLCLSRLVLTPEVPKNGASFLLMGSVRRIDAARWPCLVTFADKWRGHTGEIYRTCGWEYTGLTESRLTWVLNGRMVSPKGGSYSHTIAEMEAMGAVRAGRFQRHRFRLIRRASRRRIQPAAEQMELLGVSDG